MDSAPLFPVADNLLEREFYVDDPIRVWVTYHRYIWTREGWLCLAAILRSRQPVASGDHQRALDDNKMFCSMSRKGDCWDNAVAETFRGTI